MSVESAVLSRAALAFTVPPSPHGGATDARTALQRRFADRMTVNASFTRRLISYQDSKSTPGLRWFKYKEGFSTRLVRELLQRADGPQVLDPFAGIGTTPLTASGLGCRGWGIELMPVGILVAEGIAALSQRRHRRGFRNIAKALLQRVRQDRCEADAGYRFRHVRITRHAFPPETESALARANAFIAEEVGPRLAPLLRLACMCVLEDVSYTRKDGQYLRWDHRSGRPLRAHMEKGPIPRFADALEAKLTDMEQDMEFLPDLFGGPAPSLETGSCLEGLQNVEAASQDAVVTSPPYANRYDYTRTYALELAYLGLDEDGFRTLRQALVSATVENKCKRDWLRQVYRNVSLLHWADTAYAASAALHEPLSILQARRRELSNPQVIRMVENYFLECAVVIAELGRVVRPGGRVFMVNDNVQYHGEEFPVDLVLSEFAEQMGFLCRHIWVLPRGKGNASQQMGRFGRREQRKCVYHWERVG